MNTLFATINCFNLFDWNYKHLFTLTVIMLIALIIMLIIDAKKHKTYIQQLLTSQEIPSRDSDDTTNAFHRNTYKHIKKYRTNYLISYVCGLIFCILVLGFMMSTHHSAKIRGMYQTDISFGDMMKHNQYTHVESVVPEDKTGIIIIYYKYGCKDCEAIYNDLSSAVKDKSNIYWVSTRSEQGESLLEDYPVTEVPTAVYIRHDTYNNNITYTSKVLYTQDAEGNTILDTNALNRLLYLQSEGR